jgi:excisionase family DNA binding protein
MVKLFTVSELAVMLQISKSCLYKYVEQGKIGYKKIGSNIRFSEEDVHSFLDHTQKSSSMVHAHGEGGNYAG